MVMYPCCVPPGGASTVASNLKANNGLWADSTITSELPPSSLHKLRTLPDMAGNTNPFPAGVDGIVVGDYDTQFGSFFHSRLDNASTLGITNTSDVDNAAVGNLCNAMQSLASVLRTSAGLVPGTYNAATELAECKVLLRRRVLLKFFVSIFFRVLLACFVSIVFRVVLTFIFGFFLPCTSQV